MQPVAGQTYYGAGQAEPVHKFESPQPLAGQGPSDQSRLPSGVDTLLVVMMLDEETRIDRSIDHTIWRLQLTAPLSSQPERAAELLSFHSALPLPGLSNPIEHRTVLARGPCGQQTQHSKEEAASRFDRSCGTRPPTPILLQAARSAVQLQYSGWRSIKFVPDVCRVCLCERARPSSQLRVTDFLSLSVAAALREGLCKKSCAALC